MRYNDEHTDVYPVSLSFHETPLVAGKRPGDSFIGTLTQYCTIDNIEKHEGMDDTWYNRLMRIQERLRS